ncbi:MAG: carboxymuconolactone decarboxylase family protein [Limnohabitans sp.]
MSTTPSSPSQQARDARPDDTAFQAGIATRTQVMGSEFVDRAFGNATDYTLPMQEFITRNAWGNVWQRPGLDLKTRSLITVAMLTALGKQHELKGHVRGALNNGATPEELREVMLHATVYCGFPTAIDAFRTVTEVVESLA